MSLNKTAPGNSTDAFIVNGHPANILDYPFQVSIIASSRNEPFCGGVILTNNIILTAQHCVSTNRLDAVPASIGVGKTFWPDMLNFTVPIQYIVQYPRYKLSKIDQGKDIAILLLQRTLTFNSTVQPIAMATPADEAQGYTDAGVVADVSGWGATGTVKDPNYPKQLHAAEMKIVSREFTTNVYGTALTYDQLAAGDFPGQGKSEFNSRVFCMKMRLN